MIGYVKAWRSRAAALHECRQARREMQPFVAGIAGAAAAHPVSVLAAVAGLGLVISRLRIGSRVLTVGMRVASEPAWHLLRKLIDRLG